MCVILVEIIFIKSQNIRGILSFNLNIFTQIFQVITAAEQTQQTFTLPRKIHDVLLISLDSRISGMMPCLICRF